MHQTYNKYTSFVETKYKYEKRRGATSLFYLKTCNGSTQLFRMKAEALTIWPGLAFMLAYSQPPLMGTTTHHQPHWSTRVPGAHSTAQHCCAFVTGMPFPPVVLNSYLISQNPVKCLTGLPSLTPDSDCT